jgi:hypothetical protein
VISWRVAAWTALALGCGGAPEPPEDCSTVATGVRQYWAARATQTTDELERAAIAESERLAVERFERHCREDRWNPEMIACARAVFRLEDSGCDKFLSLTQRARLKGGAAAPIPGGITIGN